ncbi:MAG: hypothetical protein KF912_00630 [Phycisphaeraceae bacterium]|nr:hypothetical protein [Phycisphaeraceae bacterium]MBX3365804.1 hypothetical protein [Phycisphaeraceae bacterium]
MEIRTRQSDDEIAPADDACTPSLIDRVRFEPHADKWHTLVARRPLTTFQSTLRAQLGLPLDRPIIMSGHQCEFWHPGILAKWFAGEALARRVGGTFVWLHVDQDTNDPGRIFVPAIDAAERLIRQDITLVPPVTDVPTGSRRAVRVDLASSLAAVAATHRLDPSWLDGLGRIADSLNHFANEPTLATQFGLASQSLIPGAALATHDAANPRIHTITTSHLSSTDGFAALVAALRRDAVRAVDSHNHAAARRPEAGIRPLGLKVSADHPARVELPLWRVRPGTPRVGVMLSHLGEIPPHELRPRALLMTGLARLGACDIFIHGTGGGSYDRITDEWLNDWLTGSTDPETIKLAHALPLAPTVVCTATARLRFDGDRGGVNIAEARAARHLAHRARHDPQLLGDKDAGLTKRELVARIDRSRDRAERAMLFQSLHAMLDRSRAEHADRLTSLDHESRVLARKAAEEPIVRERTWPFPLYPETTLRSLRRRIEDQIMHDAPTGSPA